MLDGRRLTISVIQPDTPAELAAKLFDDIKGDVEHAELSAPNIKPRLTPRTKSLAKTFGKPVSGRRHHP
jgi:hypothetical protein